MCLPNTPGGNLGGGRFYLAKKRTFLLCVDTNPRIVHESYRGLARVWDITVYFAPGPDYNPAGNVVAQAAQAEFNLFMPLIDGSSRPNRGVLPARETGAKAIRKGKGCAVKVPRRSRRFNSAIPLLAGNYVQLVEPDV